MATRTTAAPVIPTAPVVLTTRVYDSLAEAALDRPIGPFLLRLDDSKHALAQGNVLNDQWDWAYATDVRPHAEARLFRLTDLPAHLLPEAPALPNSNRSTEGLASAKWAHLTGIKLG